MSVAATISPDGQSLVEDNEGFSPFLKRDATEHLRPAGRTGFLLLLLATAALVIRPSDLFANIEHWPIYQTIILFCLAFSSRRMIQQVRRDVRARAITTLVIAFGVLIVLSHLVRGNVYAARIGGFEFFKIALYYLLVLSGIDTIQRLRIFILALISFTLILTMLSVLSYEGLIDLPTLESIRQADASNEGGVVQRLVGTGIFNDPNDLSLILVVAIGCCFCFATWTTNRLIKLGWWFPIAFFAYAIMLTYSRGGLISLVGGTAVALVLRMGLPRTLLLSALILPILLIAYGGRQTHMDLTNPEDTFQTRLDRWSDALTLFKSSPLVGVGHDQQVELLGQVAHNTYVQSFAELGIVGGACFLGIILLAIRGVIKIDLQNADRTLTSFRPYLAGALSGYAVGLFSLSRGYTISTYLVVALAAAFINLAPRRHALALNSQFFQNLAVSSGALIVLTYLVVRTLSGVGGPG